MIIPMKGNWTYNSSTGQEERTCSKCNHKETRAHTHNYGDVQKENLLQIEQIDRKLELNAERRRTLTTLMTRGYLEPAIYAQENNDITSEADALTAEKDRLVKDVTGSLHQADSLNDLIHYAGRSEPSTNFDGALFERFIDRVTIRTRTEIVFHLKCGLNLTERIGEG